MKIKKIVLPLLLIIYGFILIIVNPNKSSAITNNLTSEQISQIENGELKLTYELFGAQGDGKTNDYESIKAAHDFANKEYAEKGKILTVYGTSGKTYYIGTTSNIINIHSNVDWQNASFIFDDYVDADNNDTNDVDVTKPVFRYVSGLYVKSINENGQGSFGAAITSSSLSDFNNKINPDVKNLHSLIEVLNDSDNYTDINNCTKCQNTIAEALKNSPRWIVEVCNSNKHYIRKGVNENEGSEQTETFILDSTTGDILSNIEWTYDDITSIRVYPIDSEQLTIKNGDFTTYTNDKVYSTSGVRSQYNYRGITIDHSGNVNIENINHYLNESKHSYTNDYQDVGNANLYLGFIYITRSAYVNVSSSNFTPHHPSKIYKNNELKSSSYNGTYDISINKSENIFFDKVGYACKSTDDECYKSYMLDDSVWGIMSSNYVKNLFITNSKLNRVDAHCGAFNLYIKDSTVGNKGLTLIGGENFYAENLTIDGASSAITLRNDYGSTWNGNFVLKNITFKTKSGYSTPSFIYSNNAEDHDFGYTTYFPNIYLSGLTVENSDSTKHNFSLLRLNDSITDTLNSSNSRNLYYFKENIYLNNVNATSDNLLLFTTAFSSNNTNLTLSSYGGDNVVNISKDSNISFTSTVPNNSKFTIKNSTYSGTIYSDTANEFATIKKLAVVPSDSNVSSFSIKYSGSNAIITSTLEMEEVSGWTLSSDKKTLTKNLISSDSGSNIKVCDISSNCETFTLKHFDTITFSDVYATYTGSNITVNNATCTSNSTITYSYYSDSSCSTKIDSVKEVGTYYVKATSIGNDSYISNSKCSKLTIKQGIPSITIGTQTLNYSGSIITPKSPSALAPNNKTTVSLNYIYKYYSDNSCTTLVKTSTGAAQIGEQPINAGIYYIQATSIATTNLSSAVSNCEKYQINQATPKLNIDNSISLTNDSESLMDYSYNGDGTLKCSSSDESIAECSIENNKLKIISRNVGTTVVNIRANETTNYQAIQGIKVNVKVINSSSDTIKPTITITPDGSEKYLKDISVKVTITDNESSIKTGQVLYYAWSTSNISEPTYVNYVKLDTSGNYAYTTINSPASVTGTYYLWIKSGIVDSNNNATNSKVSSIFKFNNSKPNINATIIKNKNKTKGTIKTNSLSKISKVEYSIDNITYNTVSNNVFTIANSDTTKYYIKVTDELDNVTTIEQNTVSESSSKVMAYILDENNNSVTSTKINSNNKNIKYRLVLSVPSLENIVEEYKEFKLTSTINENIEFIEDSIKIFNKGNEDITAKFKVTFDDTTLTIIPNEMKESFYDEEYSISIEARIKDSYQISSSNSTMENVVNLNTDDTISTSKAKIIYDTHDYISVPNTKINIGIINKTIGYSLVIAGVILFLKSICINSKSKYIKKL